MTTHNVAIGGSVSIIHRQSFESHVPKSPGFERAHLETIYEVVGREHLVMLEIQDGFGHTGYLHGTGTVGGGYNTPTLGLTGLYPNASATYYRGPDIRQVVVLDDYTLQHKVTARWMAVKREALVTVRATLAKEDANAGSWEISPIGYGDVHVSRQRHQQKYRVREDRWLVNAQGRVDTLHYGGPLAENDYFAAYTTES